MHPFVKPKSFDPVYLQKNIAHKLEILLEEEKGQIPVNAGINWLQALDPQNQLTFLGIRQENQEILYCSLIRYDSSSGTLSLLPLGDSLSPLDVLSDKKHLEWLKLPTKELDAGTESKCIRIPIEQAIQERLITLPIPYPRKVFGVAYNLPSHLKEDISLRSFDRLRSNFTNARPRVFLKHPFTPPPTTNCPTQEKEWSQCIGPFDPIVFPSKIHIPSNSSTECTSHLVPTSADYEVEVGAVLGKQLSWDTVSSQTDEEIAEAIAGFVLISDTKARNPQLMGKLISNKITSKKGLASYRFPHHGLNRLLGEWNQQVCQWWSYAASYGDYTAIGPFFVSADTLKLEEGIGLISARKYYMNELRKGSFAPMSDTFFLRQSSVITNALGHPDSLIWDVPQIIRSILNPVENALSFDSENLHLEAGDIIMLGTPGGTVLTGKPQWQIDLLRRVFFWRSPKNWHDWIYNRTKHFYLHSGDEIFFFAESLGFQRHTVQMLEV